MKGSVKKIAEGLWRVRWDEAASIGSPRRQRSRSVRGNREEAHRVYALLMAGVRNQEKEALERSSPQTVAEFLNSWISRVEKARIADTTFVAYRQHVRDHLVPTIGDIELSSLQAEDIELAMELWRTRVIDVPSRKRPPRSERTVKHIFDTLRTALNSACRRIDRQPAPLTRNPCLDVRLRRVPKPKIKQIDEGAASLVLSAFDDVTECLACVLCISSGFRRSEALGLRWLDLQEKPGFAVVNRVCIKRRDGSWAYEYRNKDAGQANRAVALLPIVLEKLSHYKIKQQSGFALAGLHWKPDVPVLSRPDGSTMTPNQLSGRFRRVIKTKKLPSVSLHGLRHSFSLIGSTVGIGIDVRSKILGHEILSTTANIYDGVLPDRVAEQSAALMELALGSAIKLALKDL